MEPRPWWRLNETALMDKRISDLDLQISGTALGPMIQKLYQELQEKDLIFRPPCFLADEWFCPVGVPAIGIPFYLAHPRLRRLEKKIILEAEGSIKSDFMKLIRHEAGHAYSYAYNIHKKAKWRRLFGLSSKEYKDTYNPKPYSRAYVFHLENWYAQSHPDEDFAETFAIWLTPGKNWRRKYRSWKGALEKLEYVDQVMKSISGKPPVNNPRFHPNEYSGLKLKLKTYYQRKKKLYEEDFPDFYDNDLTALFTKSAEERSDVTASHYLRKHKEKIVHAVARWTREKRFTADQLLKNLIPRCRELNLYIRKGDNEIDFQVTAYIATLISNHLFTGKFKRTK